MGEFKTGMKLFASVVRENYTKLTLLSVFKKVLLIVGSLLAFREKSIRKAAINFRVENNTPHSN